MIEPHKVLGLPPWATDEELKHRFHELALLHHPDKGGDAEAFKTIAEAYRQMLGSIRPQPPPSAPPPPANGPQPLYEEDEKMIVCQMTATVAEIKQGKVLPLTYQRSFRCMACNATVELGQPPCRACAGRGYFTKTETLHARIQAL